MPLVLSLVLLQDLPSVHKLWLSAPSPTAKIIFPKGASPTSVAHLTKQDEKDMQNPKCTSRHVMIRDCVDDEAGREGKGEIVSYAMWNFLVGRKEGDSGGDGAYYDEWPGDARQDIIKDLVAKAKKKREDTMGKGDYAHLFFLDKALPILNSHTIHKTHLLQVLATLATSPTHRRLGAASKLVSWGCQLADTHHLPIYVESTAAGLPVYQKHGFQKVSTLTVDLRPYGADHVHDNTVLVRPAKPPDAHIDAVCLSPILTNADLAAFPMIESEAFTGPSPPVEPNNEQNHKKRPPTSIFPLILHSIPPATILSHRTTTIIHNSLTTPQIHYIKAFIPRSNRIVGWASYTLHPPAPSPPSFPPGHNTALASALFSREAALRDSHMSGKKAYLYLRVVVVTPDWQGRGAGKGLVREVCRVADQKGVEAWVDASGGGRRLYEGAGWKEVGETGVELGEWGGEGREVVVGMVREVGGGKGVET
ncbi:hypothetical protein ACLMJK_008293 [Lecanora helva]